MASKPSTIYREREMNPASTKFVDLILQVVAVVMGIAAITLIALNLITAEKAVILLSVGMLAMALERLSEKE